MTNLPPNKLIKDVLDGMLGKEVSISPADALTSADTVGGALSTYVDDASALWAVIGWDLTLGACVGAAVGLVPKGAAEDAIEERYIPEHLLENLSEVANVLASVFQIPGNPHLRLEKTFNPLNSAGDQAIQLLYALGNRIDLNVEVPGYGTGRLAVAMRY